MSALLPSSNTCCDPCEEPVSVAVPGPAGATGAAGTNGTNGVNAFTTVSSYAPAAQPVMPAELANVTLNVGNSTWMFATQVVYVETRGYMEVQSKPSSTSVILKNLEDAATNAYLSNSPAGTSFTAGLGISPGGLQGPSNGGPTISSGNGSPEGVVTAVVGSLYTDLLTGNFYKKLAGSGNTGWG